MNHKALVLGLAVILCLGAGVAASQPPAMVTTPEWVRQPSPEQMSTYLPPKAMREGKSGRATLNCEVTTAGLVHRCVVSSETPVGYGIGEAALLMSKFFEMKPETRNGQPVEARVSIPFHFKCGGCGRSKVETRRHFANSPWLAAPTFDQWKAAYPARARQAGASGSVSLECKFRQEGQLMGCRVMAENPRGMGFGAAAKSLVPHFRGIEVDGEGKPTKNATVALNIAWPAEAVAADRARGLPMVFRTPASTDVAAAFPSGARAEGLTEGRATVACTLAEGGDLTACRVASETPASKGFGQSALTMAAKVRYSLWSSDGMPVPRSVAIPFSFDGGPRA